MIWTFSGSLPQNPYSHSKISIFGFMWAKPITVSNIDSQAILTKCTTNQVYYNICIELGRAQQLFALNTKIFGTRHQKSSTDCNLNVIFSIETYQMCLSLNWFDFLGKNWKYFLKRSQSIELIPFEMEFSI